MRLGVFLFALATITPAQAHTVWHNGDPVPDWVQNRCCGVADAHRIDESQVHTEGSDYVIEVEGKTLRVPIKEALPSQDGEFWVFFNKDMLTPTVYCIFIPMSG